MKTIKLTCANPNCGNAFEKDIVVYKSKKKYGQHNFYCKPECLWAVQQHTRIASERRPAWQ